MTWIYTRMCQCIYVQKEQFKASWINRGNRKGMYKNKDTKCRIILRNHKKKDYV